MVIRPYEPGDRAEWQRMRRALWPDIAGEGESADAAAWLARPHAAVIVAARPDGEGLAGFTELDLRPYVDGCTTSPVAYLEGWWVDADVRGTGVGAALVRASEVWARAQGCREFASDALLDNSTAHAAHRAVGFTEVERLVIFRRALGDGGLE